MGTVTKNPMILQSANYIYNWFLSKNPSNDFIKNVNILESIESDETVLKSLDKNYKNKKEFEGIDERLKKYE